MQGRLAELVNFGVAALFASAVVFELAALPISIVTAIIIAVLTVIAALCFRRGVAARRRRRGVTG